MTQDEIIQILHNVVAENQNFTTWTISTPHLVALVNHAIAKEREACAEICDDQAGGAYWEGADACANRIRARRQSD
jgi:hypothetical protein